jgi:hypothetical protein
MNTYIKLPHIKRLLLLALSLSAFSHILAGSSGYIWKPVKDEVYLQEVSLIIPTEQPVFSVAGANGIFYALIGEHVYLIEEGTLHRDRSAPKGITALRNENGLIWAISNNGLHKLQNRKWVKVDNRQFIDLCMHNGILHAATREEIFILEGEKFISLKPETGYYSTNTTMLMEDGTQIHQTPVRLGPVERIESYSGTLYVLRPGELVHFNGLVVDNGFIDWGSLPSDVTSDMLSYGNRLFIGTDKGLAVLRGATMSLLEGRDGLPVEEITCLEKGFNGDLWIGTRRGAVRMVNNNWHYFGADLWLPDNDVNDIATGSNIVFIATDGGLGIISYEPYTLQKKADFFERHIEEWGHKRLGLIHALYKKDGEWIRQISDNDGGRTAPYLAAMSYKYAVTGDQQAREEAVSSFKAMLWLERITPIDGYMARAIWSTTADKDEMSQHGSGGLPAKWYPTPDGKWYWKGDTSSDEVIAMFYAVSIFYDLAAEGKEKEEARDLLDRIASNIIDNGWVIKDIDGITTRWGRWNPEYLLRPYGYSDRGLNGLQALTFMETAYSVTGNKKFKQGLRQLIDWGYPENTIRQKNTFPPRSITTWDDNLAFLSYITILRYAGDPSLRSFYLRSLERTWEIKRMEQIPWFNFVYGAMTGNEAELEESARHLREWVLDCTDYSYKNSHRDDLFVEPGYISYEGGKKRISPREMSVKRAQRSAIALDGAAGGRRVTEPTGYIRDYWMGRYYGFIAAPETGDPELISVERRGIRAGASPYNGPERPELF